MNLRMRLRVPAGLGLCFAGLCLIGLGLAGCAARQPQLALPAGKVTPQMGSSSSELHNYQIADWVAPDDKTLIVSAVDRSLFEARFKRRCDGLRTVDTIAFILQDTPQVDKYPGIVLPDGSRCAFSSVTRLLPTSAPAEH